MDETRSNMPDEYDRLLGSLHGLPDTYATKPSIVRTIPPLGIGGTRVFVIQTWRQYDKVTNKKGEEITKAKDLIFLEVTGPGGMTRLVLPDSVSDIIIRQRESLTKKRMKQQGKRIASERKDRGEAFGFQKGTKP